MGHELVAKRRCLTKEVCLEHGDNMRGAVMIAYPAYHRLPVYDPTRLELEDKEELDGHSELQQVLDHIQTNLWWAGKELRLDEGTHKAMLAHYYKKQEENKKLNDDEDDSYLDSEWANPKSLKSALVGGGRPIKARLGA